MIDAKEKYLSNNWNRRANNHFILWIFLKEFSCHSFESYYRILTCSCQLNHNLPYILMMPHLVKNYLCVFHYSFTSAHKVDNFIKDGALIQKEDPSI